MRIDVWSDIACPWCYIGKRRLETALEGFEHADEVELVWHSFELDPSAPVPPTETAATALARKYGSANQVEAMMAQVTTVASGEGLDYRLEDTLHLNTRDGHRLLHLALETGGPELQGRLKEAFLDAYFVKALDVTDHAVLREVATSVGLDGSAVERVLGSDEYDADVDADVRQARAYGASGVPFFVIDGRYGISGAQPTSMFSGALAQAWSESHPVLQTFAPAAGAGADAAGAGAGAAGAGADAAAGADHAAEDGNDSITEGAVCGPDGCTP